MAGAPRESRNVARPIVDYLRKHLQPGEVVAVSAVWNPRREVINADYSTLFVLLDAGIPAEIVRLDVPQPSLPRWMISVQSVMRGGRMRQPGRRLYREVAADTWNRTGLFELRDGPKPPR